MPALIRHRKIARASLNFVSLFRVNFYAVEASVFLRIQRYVAQVVLAAQLLRNLVEGCFQFLGFISNFNDASAGFGGELFHFAIASEGSSLRPVKASVGAQ